ncbi:hypothetical protein N9K64_03070 [Rhodobacteraceae bacterium]|nr:hypothetical protein [Paracoccaceae bacterium]
MASTRVFRRDTNRIRPHTKFGSLSITMRVVGSMSLNQMASDPRATNGSAKVEDEARVAFKNVGVEGLIDQPTH